MLIDIQDHSEGIKQIASEDAEIIEKDKSYNGNQVILEQSVIVKGNLKVNCSRITSKGYIIAEKILHLTHQSQKAAAIKESLLHPRREI